MSAFTVYSARRKRSRSIGPPAMVRAVSAPTTAPMSEHSGNSNTTLTRFTKAYKGKASLRRYKSKAEKRIARIASSVVSSTLKNRIEVKYLTWAGQGHSVGQTFTIAGPSTTSGHFSIDIAGPTRGTGSNEMIGDKCRLKNLLLNFNFRGQAGCSNDKHIKLLLVRYKAPQPTSVISQVVRVNAAIDQANGGSGSGSVAVIYDTCSIRNVDFADSAEIVFEKDILVEASANGTGTGPKVIKQDINLTIPMYGRVYELNGSIVVNNLYTLYLLCDSGDRGAVAPTLLGIQENTASTGLSFIYNAMLQFTDM